MTEDPMQVYREPWRPGLWPMPAPDLFEPRKREPDLIMAGVGWCAPSGTEYGVDPE